MEGTMQCWRFLFPRHSPDGTTEYSQLAAGSAQSVVTPMMGSRGAKICNTMQAPVNQEPR